MLEFALIFGLLLLIGFGLPIPEESVLLLAAYFIATQSEALPMMVFCVAGIIVSDAILYVKGRLRSRQFKGFKRGKVFMSTVGFFAVFTARFFIASRVVMPFMAGAMQMKRLSFHVASVCGAFVLASVVLLGGTALYALLAKAVSFAPAIWMALLIVATGVLMMYATRSQVQLAKND